MNKIKRRIPVSNCTLSDLADKLLAMPPQTMMKIAEEKDGSETWGAECIKKFGLCVLHFGYEGGFGYEIHNEESHNTKEESRADLIEKLKYHLNKEEYDTVYLYMPEPVYSGLYVLVADDTCDEEDIEKVLQGDKETYTNLLLAEKIELYVMPEFVDAFNAEKINTAVHTIYTMDADTREILRLK